MSHYLDSVTVSAVIIHRYPFGPLASGNCSSIGVNIFAYDFHMQKGLKNEMLETQIDELVMK